MVKETVNKYEFISKYFLRICYEKEKKSTMLTNNDLKLFKYLVSHENNSKILITFAKNITKLSHYGYWRILSSLYIKGGYCIPLEVWKKMFTMPFDKRQKGLMNEEELKVFCSLPKQVKAYRIHKNNESDWISYTLSLNTALNFIEVYSEQCIYGGTESCTINKDDILAYFARRNEQEIIVLDKTKMKNVIHERF